MPVSEMWSCISDQVTVIMINLLYTLPTLSKKFEINILDQLYKDYLLKKNTFKKELWLIFLCVLYFELKIIINASKRCVFVESGSEVRRLLGIMCVGFLADHRFCKHPQSQLVRVYQRFIYNFSNTFPLHLILSSMVWYFQNNSESLVIEVILQ